MSSTKYSTLFDTLKKEILSGKYRSSNPFPSVRGLIGRFGLSDRTVRRALDELFAQGLISRKQGRGTFVTNQGKSRKIGLILSGVVNQAFFSPIVTAIVSEAEKHGYELVFGNQDASSMHELVQETKAFVSRLVTERVSGVIYHPIGGVKDARVNRTILEPFKTASIPVVLLGWDIDIPPKRSEYDVIGINNCDAGYRIAKHMIESGARQICFLMRPYAGTSVRNRMAGVQAAVRDAKNRCRFMVVESDHPSAVALKCGGRMKRPDAFICGNDGMLPSVRKVIEQMRLRVPDDAMLAAFDDLQLASMQTPALTTVHQPCAEIGTAVFKRMIERLNNRDEAAREICMRVDLVIRESTRRTIFRGDRGKTKRLKGKAV